VKVGVGDVKVAFDVEGAWLVPMGAWMVERPTVILIGDPLAMRLLGSSLAEVAQVIYLEDRQADVAGFCEALEIERPILIAIGAADELPAGFPGLVLGVDYPDAVAAARRFVHAVQASG
jgi:hypothetical protein